MHSGENTSLRIPTLVQFCQRVASANVNNIYGFGSMPPELVKPILENSSPDTLLRLEHSSPIIEKETSSIWKDLCFRSFPLFHHLLLNEPDCWRDQYYVLRDMEARKLEESTAKLRNSRQEANERKKESAIKQIDRVPPPKRARTWGTAPPKSLLQKARTEASRMHKGVYGARIMPPKQNRVLASAASAKLPPPRPPSGPSTSSFGSRVTVTAVAVRRSPTTSASSPAMSTPAPCVAPPVTTGISLPRKPVVSTTAVTTQLVTPSHSDNHPPPVKSPSKQKKDPMSTLFMPKHRAYSQLPSRTLSSRRIQPET